MSPDDGYCKLLPTHLSLWHSCMQSPEMVATYYTSVAVDARLCCRLPQGLMNLQQSASCWQTVLHSCKSDEHITCSQLIRWVLWVGVCTVLGEEAQTCACHKHLCKATAQGTCICADVLYDCASRHTYVTVPDEETGMPYSPYEAHHMHPDALTNTTVCKYVKPRDLESDVSTERAS